MPYSVNFGGFASSRCERFHSSFSLLSEMAVLASKDLTAAQKLPQVAFDLMQKTITDLGVQCLTN